MFGRTVIWTGRCRGNVRISTAMSPRWSRRRTAMGWTSRETVRPVGRVKARKLRSSASRPGAVVLFDCAVTAFIRMSFRTGTMRNAKTRNAHINYFASAQHDYPAGQFRRARAGDLLHLTDHGLHIANVEDSVHGTATNTSVGDHDLAWSIAIHLLDHVGQGRAMENELAVLPCRHLGRIDTRRLPDPVVGLDKLLPSTQQPLRITMR